MKKHKQALPNITQDVVSQHATIINKIHDALEADLKTYTKEAYNELIVKKLQEEELKKEKFIKENNEKEILYTNNLIINYHLIQSLLNYDPRYNKLN